MLLVYANDTNSTVKAKVEVASIHAAGTRQYKEQHSQG